MRPKLALKTLYRSPVRTVLTFILLAAVTFALFSQVIEYAIATREMKKAVELYDGVTTVEVSPLSEEAMAAETPAYMFSDERVGVEHLPEKIQERFRALTYERLTPEQIEALSALPYISHVDKRYMTAGYSDTLERTDSGREYFDYTQQCVIEATVCFSYYGRVTVGDIEVVGGETKRPLTKNDYIFVVAETSRRHNDVKSPENYVYYYTSGFPERATTMITSNRPWGEEFLQTLEIGKRYLFVLRYENYTIDYSDTEQYFLTDPFVQEYCDAVIPFEGEPENYLETDKFAGVRDYIDRIETNKYTFDVVYTENTGSIRYFADKTMGISEGRGITREDTEQKNNVCVIHYDMAAEHELKVGDTITLKLGDKLFEQYITNGAQAVSPEMESENLTEVTLEIVGLFKDSRNDDIMMRDPAWSYAASTIFVPKHLINVSDKELENHTFSPSEISFVIEDAWNIPAFAQECIPQIEEMGLTVFFSDSGFTEMIDGYRETERLALIKLAVLAGSVFVSTCFVAFLYIVGKRRDYAIMRVLGTSKRKSARALLLPLLVMAVAAVIIGSATSVIYAQNSVVSNDSIEYLSSMITVDTTIPASVIVGCALGEIALTLFIALVMVALIGRSSPLALIQAQTQRQNKKKEKKAKNAVPESTEPVVLGEWVSIDPVKHDGKSRKWSFTAKYILRHIKRTGGKAVMLVLVTLLLLSVAGQLTIMDVSYNKIFEETPITSNYAGFLNVNYVMQLLDSGYASEVYYESNTSVSINGLPCNAFITSDIDRFAGAADTTVTWAEGYDESVMKNIGNVAVVGERIMIEYGIKPGDTVRIGSDMVLSMVIKDLFNDYANENGFSTGDRDKYTWWLNNIRPELDEEINAELSQRTVKCTVVGTVSSDAVLYENGIFMPGTSELSSSYGKLVILDIIEATLADNWQADEYRAFGEKLASANKTGEVAFLMDTSKIENVRNNIKLMDTLYPIIVAAILVIGAFLCGLLIVQTSKDIAIMRVLGTSKRRVRAIMIIEHTALCLAGIILASIVLAVRKVSLEVFGQMAIVFTLYFGAILAASVIAAIAASRKNVLELLQTKE